MFNPDRQVQNSNSLHQVPKEAEQGRHARILKVDAHGGEIEHQPHDREQRDPEHGNQAAQRPDADCGDEARVRGQGLHEGGLEVAVEIRVAESPRGRRRKSVGTELEGGCDETDEDGHGLEGWVAHEEEARGRHVGAGGVVEVRLCCGMSAVQRGKDVERHRRPRGPCGKGPI